MPPRYRSGDVNGHEKTLASARIAVTDTICQNEMAGAAQGDVASISTTPPQGTRLTFRPWLASTSYSRRLPENKKANDLRDTNDLLPRYLVEFLQHPPAHMRGLFTDDLGPSSDALAFSCLGNDCQDLLPNYSLSRRFLCLS